MLIPDPVAVFNERVKLVASSLNATGLGVLALAAVKPLVENGPGISVGWSVAGLALHGVAHYVMGHLKKRGDA